MSTNIASSPPIRANSLDKLAQLGNSRSKDTLSTLQKRARSKWYTRSIVGGLVYTVDEDDILFKYYNNALHCNHRLVQNGLEITGKFCNTRVCNVCNRIRTAKLMSSYIKQMVNFEKIEFTTLTVPNCHAKDLENTIKEMYRTWIKIVDVYKKRGQHISGIRKLEITYNWRTDTYHPHFHILSDVDNGEEFIAEWLKRNPTANRKGQDTRNADQNSLNEIFKYTTKVLFKDKKSTKNFTVYANAINTIIRTLYGKRCVQNFGNVRKESEDVLEGLQAQTYEGIQEYESMTWDWKDCDWVDVPTNKKTLTGYVSPDIEFDIII